MHIIIICYSGEFYQILGYPLCLQDCPNRTVVVVAVAAAPPPAPAPAVVIAAVVVVTAGAAAAAAAAAVAAAVVVHHRHHYSRGHSGIPLPAVHLDTATPYAYKISKSLPFQRPPPRLLSLSPISLIIQKKYVL